jgi:hypothetical protein
MSDLARLLSAERVVEVTTVDGPLLVTFERRGDAPERLLSVHDDPGNRLAGAAEAGAIAAVAAGHGNVIYVNERYELLGFDGRYVLTIERTPGEETPRLARATRDGAPYPVDGETGLTLLHRLAATA